MNRVVSKTMLRRCCVSWETVGFEFILWQELRASDNDGGSWSPGKIFFERNEGMMMVAQEWQAECPIHIFCG